MRTNAYPCALATTSAIALSCSVKKFCFEGLKWIIKACWFMLSQYHKSFCLNILSVLKSSIGLFDVATGAVYREKNLLRFSSAKVLVPVDIFEFHIQNVRQFNGLVNLLFHNQCQPVSLAISIVYRSVGFWRRLRRRQRQRRRRHSARRRRRRRRRRSRRRRWRQQQHRRRR